jgi:hypothetical protein
MEMKLKYGDALSVYFKRIRVPQATSGNNGNSSVLAFESNLPGISTQDVWARLHYNRPYVGRSVVDKAFPGVRYYKHQILVSRMSYITDSVFIMHDPGTGKTITLLHAVMNQMKAGAIKKFYIINNSSKGNNVALATLEMLYPEYKSHFLVSFKQFLKEAVITTTNSKVGEISFEDNVGVIIDEAHNLLSDSESPDVKKVPGFKSLVSKLSKYVGIKLFLATATPIFGDHTNIDSYQHLLFRMPDAVYELGKIPTCMTSYTQINYNHLRIVQMMNEEYSHLPTPEERGDLSFRLSNGYEYPFKVFINKPSPMQIADLISMAYHKRATSFQAGSKQLVVCSEPRVINGKKVMQSSLLKSILSLIEKTRYGTVIIYCDLVERGSKAAANFFKQNGWEQYTRGCSSSASVSKAARKNKNKDENDSVAESRSSSVKEEEEESEKYMRLAQEISNLDREIFELRGQLRGTSKDKCDSLVQQLNSFPRFLSIAREDKKYSQDGGEGRMLEAFREYVKSYQEEFEIDMRISNSIDEKTFLYKALKEEIAILRPEKRTENTNTNMNTIAAKHNKRFIIYSSMMTAAENNAFADFNSPENWDGSICKVIIGSRVMRDGVDIKHAVQTHIIIPEWRIPGIVQAQHRGIRSNGHDAIIEKLTEKLTKERNANREEGTPEMKENEARAIVIANKITVELYHHYIKSELVTGEDLEECRQYLTPEISSSNLSREELTELFDKAVDKYNAGASIYNAAINTHRTVGSAMMDIWKNSLDYKLNVNVESRVELELDEEGREEQRREFTAEDMLGVNATDLFHSEDYTNLIIGEMTKLLLQHKKINTDEIFDFFLKNSEAQTRAETHSYIFTSTYTGPVVIESMIATAIVELTTYRKYVYNQDYGIHMVVNLYETETESILYLSTNSEEYGRGKYIHPNNAYVDSLGYTVHKSLAREETFIEQGDLAIPKDLMTVNKLKDVIKRAVSGKSHLTQIEITFLIQMNNYWAFGWEDMISCFSEATTNTNPTTRRDISVYVLEDHIHNPSINILAKELLISEYKPSVGKWSPAKATSLHKLVLVRYATLVNAYRRFQFNKLPEFASLEKYKSNQMLAPHSDCNGIVLIKGYYDYDYDYDYDSNTQDDGHKLETRRLLSSPLALSEPYSGNIVVKSFMDPRSRGSQIKKLLMAIAAESETEMRKAHITTKDDIIEIVDDLISEDIMLMFFIYNKDFSVRDGRAMTIFDIKKKEYDTMLEAMSGNPSYRFQIKAVEDRITDKTRKQEIYRMVYSLAN